MKDESGRALSLLMSGNRTLKKIVLDNNLLSYKFIEEI